MFWKPGQLFGLTFVRDWRRFNAAPSGGRAETSTPGGVRYPVHPPASIPKSVPSSSSFPLPSSSQPSISSSFCPTLYSRRLCMSATCWSPVAGWCPPPPPAGSWWGGSWCLRGVWSAGCCRWCWGWFPGRPPASRLRRRCCSRLPLWSAWGGHGSLPCGLRPKAPSGVKHAHVPSSSGLCRASAERDSPIVSWTEVREKVCLHEAFHRSKRFSIKQKQQRPFKCFRAHLCRFLLK